MDALDRDWTGNFSGLKEDWEIIEKILPAGWEKKARELGAFVRKRGIANAAVLLRVLLIHLSDGCSLRQTAVRAREGGLTDVSDVALLNRLRSSGEWFGWMGQSLTASMSAWPPALLPGKRVRLVDGSIVCEPGATGSTWRLHYAIDLSNLRCDEVHVTTAKEGETLRRFQVQAGDVLMADRGFANRRGVRHVTGHGGDVVARMNLDNTPLEDTSGERFDVLSRLRQLSYGQTGSWVAQIRDEQGVIAVRVCAIKKTAEQTRRAQDRLRKEAKKKQRRVKPETLEAAGYIIVLTTLMELAAETIMELYRVRWQIELAFKRLKSLLQMGHLKKTDPQGAKAWLQGKLLVAALIEKLIAIGERFSPWGYVWPASGAPSEAMCLAGDGNDALLVQPCSQSRDGLAGRLTPLEQNRNRIAGGASKASLSERPT